MVPACRLPSRPKTLGSHGQCLIPRGLLELLSKFLKGWLYRELYRGVSLGLIKEDTRSFDSSWLGDSRGLVPIEKRFRASVH